MKSPALVFVASFLVLEAATVCGKKKKRNEKLRLHLANAVKVSRGHLNERRQVLCGR